MADAKAKIILEAEDNASEKIGKIQSSLNTLKNFIIGARIFEFLKDGIVSSVKAAQEQEVATTRLNTVLASTKGAVGLTSDEIMRLNTQLSISSGIQDDAILTGQNMLLTFKNLKEDGFKSASKAMVDMDTAFTNGNSTAESMQGTAIRLGKALNDPIAGLGALSRVGVQFNEQQKEQITTMVKAGDTAGAQKIILKELESQFGGTAEAIGNTFTGKLKKATVALDEMKETIGGKIIPILGLFFEATVSTGSALSKAFEGGGINFNSLLKVVTKGAVLIVESFSAVILIVKSFADGILTAADSAKIGFLKIKGAFSDTTKEIEDLDKQKNERIQRNHEALVGIFNAHTQNMKNIDSEFNESVKKNSSSALISKTSDLEKETFVSKEELEKRNKLAEKQKEDEEKRRKERGKAAEEEAARLDKIKWDQFNLQEKLNEEFDAGQIRLLDRKLERENLSKDEQMKAITAVLDHAGVSEEAREKLEDKLLAVKKAMADEDKAKQKKVSDAISSFSTELTDAVISNHENAGKAVGNIVKRQVNGMINVWAAEQIAKATVVAWGNSFWTFGASLAALVGQVAMITGGAAVGKAVVNSVQFHEGGVVGSGGAITSSSVQPGEQMAKLQKGEMVLTQSDQQNLMRMIRGGGNGLGGNLTVNVTLDRKILGRAIVDLQNLNKAGVL